ncbi:MAG: hypothetical protein WCF84_16820 [Anaerolineae bacterium]
MYPLDQENKQSAQSSGASGAQGTNNQTVSAAAQGSPDGKPIVFDTPPVEQVDPVTGAHYFTGTAHYQDPGGLGKFTIRVSGQPATLDEYTSQVRILLLQTQPLAQVRPETVKQYQDASRDYLRQQWNKRLDALRAFVDQDAPVEFLMDPDRLWSEFRKREQAQVSDDSRSNWQQDCVIEIIPEGLERGSVYWMECQLDPRCVTPPHRDVYRKTGTAFPSLIPRGGNPYLYSLWESDGYAVVGHAAVTSGDGNVACYDINMASFIRID